MKDPFTNVMKSEKFGVRDTGRAEVPVPSVYYGNNQADLAVFVPSQDLWYVKSHTTGRVEVVQYGVGRFSNYQVPAPQNFFGYGYAQLAVFVPSQDLWLIIKPSTGQQRIYTFGF
jgi:hypothetical protein